MPSPVLDAGVPFRFLAPTPLRWVDVDSEGVVNNAVYLSLMEQARFLYFEQLGVLPQDRLPFVLADARTTFLLPGRLRMDMATAARVCRLGRSSFDMVFEVRGNGRNTGFLHQGRRPQLERQGLGEHAAGGR